MSNYVNDALLDASPYKKQQEEAKNLVNKWDKTGLLDGLNEDFQRSGMAVMLENQAKQLISENSATGGGAGTGTAGTAGSEAEGFGNTDLGFRVPGQDVNSLQGKTGPSSPGGAGDQVAPFGVGGLYGEGRYDYSVNSALSNELTLGGAAASGVFATASATYKDINFNQEFSSSLGNITKITVATGDLSALDKRAVRSYNITGSAGFLTAEAKQATLLPQFTSHNEDADTIDFFVSGSTTAVFKSDHKIKVVYSKQPTEADRGDFEDTTGSAVDDTLAIPEVDLQLKSSAIVAKTRKLKAVWSPELAQDLNAYHSVDAEAELTSCLLYTSDAADE